MGLLTEYYMWTEVDKNGNEGSIVAVAPDIGMINLITRNKEIAIGIFREMAIVHKNMSKNQVRLLRWTAVEYVEIIGKVKPK